jgi:SAM-dependent methyltransferase
MMRAPPRSPGGDVDYQRHGVGYAQKRRTDPRIAARVHAAFGAAKTVLNVGAGAGSYEPRDRYVVALEPSPAMRAQRPRELVPAIHGFAENLPFDDATFDATMATVTIHQWSDAERGLGELRRVTRGPIVILTFDGDALDRFWLAHYAPELIAAERGRYPAIERIRSAVGGRSEVEVVPVPIDCVDGFTEAYYARPESFLHGEVRRSQSAWTFLAPGIEDACVERLRGELASGAWESRFGHFRALPEFEGSLRLIIAHPL